MIKFFYRLTTSVCTILLLLLLGAAFTPLPHRLQHWLHTSVRSGVNPPQAMVVLGGGGIPSESGLLRCYAAAELYAKLKPNTVIIALPAGDNLETSDTMKMRDELVMRGIPDNIIQLETKGLNTAEQAKEVATLVGEEGQMTSTLIVTHPSHMRRSMLSFKKSGFIDVVSGAAESQGVNADLGANTLWRYRFWNNLKLEIECLREIIALQYYKHKGWI